MEVEIISLNELEIIEEAITPAGGYACDDFWR
jgi:hypothetical protein